LQVGYTVAPDRSGAEPDRIVGAPDAAAAIAHSDHGRT